VPSYNANPRNLSVGSGSSALPDRSSDSSNGRVSDDLGLGLVRVIGNDELSRQDADREAANAEAEDYSPQELQGIAAHIRDKFYEFRTQRESRGVSQRLIDALRAYRGEYTPQKLAEIKTFGGSTVYARLSALKCRGATAMLRDIYLAGERPWFVSPTPKPTLPEDVTVALMDLVKVEMANLEAAGQPINQKQVQDRIKQLTKGAEKAAKGVAVEEANKATDYLDDMLVEGGFYESLTEFLHYLTVFPYAFMKGPVVRMATDVKWVNGEAVVQDVPKMYWESPNPFDIYWSTGVKNFSGTDIIEHIRMSRSDLNDLLGVPGYREEAIRGALDTYGAGGLSDWMDYTDSERAVLEQREDPHFNESDLIDSLEFTGKLQGHMLLQYGLSEEEVPDPTKDYFCKAWLIDHYLIKVQIDPNPRKRHEYYMTSFEKVPGAIVGHGVPEILEDIQDVANATLRSLVNNLSIASGPQVVINDDRMSPNTDSDDLYPWKRWHTMTDPMAAGSTEKAVEFFQPDSRSNEMLQVYNQMTVIADEISSIPRYMTGSGSGQGGAGRTASGLGMLMENAGKVMQSVAANVDTDIFSPLLQRLYDTVLLTDGTQKLRGDEQIRVRGVVFANQKETERSRMLEFLNMTANPIDSQIVGMEGRAELLREIADRIGLDHTSIVPDKESIQQQQKQQNMATMQGGDPAANPSDEAGKVDENLRGDLQGPSGQN
jgi:hypothetical protein